MSQHSLSLKNLLSAISTQLAIKIDKALGGY
jgi:hypothetical protein